MTTQPTAGTASSPVGIAAIGLALPSLALDVVELANLRGVDPNKFTLGLGCGSMALCAEDEGVVDLAVRAARRALERWGGDPATIGLLAVGTESAVDMSRPLSAWVASALDLAGTVRSYEVKHACYGGTLALRQAIEWKASGASQGRAALVVSADVALYAPQDPGEPTQGAGAVAMIIDDARVAAVDVESHAWSEPEFDFWRPVGEDYPRVDGPLSLDCYKRAAERCFGQWLGERSATDALDELSAVCFHVPFPKMVKKAVLHLGETLGWSETESQAFFEQKVAATMAWNRDVGNAYTASLWLSVAGTLAGLHENERIGAFSYGSGYGSELLTLSAGREAAAGAWQEDFTADLAGRRMIDASTYAALRGDAPSIAVA